VERKQNGENASEVETLITVGLRLPESLHKELAELAGRHDRSIAAEARQAVRAHLESERQAA
jgi:plasmid stability protein